MCSCSRTVFLAFCAPVLTTVTPERHTMHRHHAAGPGVTMQCKQQVQVNLQRGSAPCLP